MYIRIDIPYFAGVIAGMRRAIINSGACVSYHFACQIMPRVGNVFLGYSKIYGRSSLSPSLQGFGEMFLWFEFGVILEKMILYHISFLDYISYRVSSNCYNSAFTS